MSLAATLALNVPAITALCTGPRGPQGATILTGSGAPLTANGNIGDVYIDVQNSFIYGPKPLSSSWGSAQTLTTSVSTIFTPLVLSAYNFVSYTNYYSGAPLTYASTGQDLTYTPLTLMGYTSSYLQSYIQNFSSSVSASTDIVAANNIGAYIDLGINSSNYNGNLYTPTFNICGPNDSYLYNSFGNMTIGTGSNAGGDFIIFTNGTLSGTHDQGGNESLRVKANGNVGIGTSSPNTRLEVAALSAQIRSTGPSSNSSWPTVGVNSNTGTNWKSSITYQSNGSPKWEAGVDISANGSQNYYIYDDVAQATRFYINGAGNVGIGTNAPNQALTVNGSISSTGNIGSTGTATIGSQLTVTANITSTGAIAVGSFTNIQTSTYTINDSDCGGIIYLSGNNVVPIFAVLPNPNILRNGFQTTIIQAGPGQIIFNANGNTLHQSYGLTRTSTLWSAATLTYNTTFGWVLFGDLA
jgi:hypothetical protein